MHLWGNGKKQAQSGKTRSRFLVPVPSIIQDAGLCEASEKSMHGFEGSQNLSLDERLIMVQRQSSPFPDSRGSPLWVTAVLSSTWSLGP